MSSKQQSPRQSQESLSTPTRSLIVLSVPISENESKLQQDLSHTYLGVEKVSRLYLNDGNPANSIQVDFKSTKVAMDILTEEKILIGGKRYRVRPYWPLVCHRCQREGHKAVDCPDKTLTEQRMMQLFREQQAHLETMIKEFETKWNARLSELTTPSVNTDVEKLLPAFNDLTTVFRHFNDYNAQMQKALIPVINRVQEVQAKLNGQQEFPALPQPAGSRVSLHNGH